MTEESPAYNELAAAELEKLLQARWDGQPKIVSPFRDGDYLVVADPLPRLSVRDGQMIVTTPATYLPDENFGRLVELLDSVFVEWHLTGLRGEEVRRARDYPDLSMREWHWVLNRAYSVISKNPLA